MSFQVSHLSILGLWINISFSKDQRFSGVAALTCPALTSGPGRPSNDLINPLTYCTECPKDMINVTTQTENLQKDKATLCRTKCQIEMQQKMGRCLQVVGEPQLLNNSEVNRCTLFFSFAVSLFHVESR